MAPENGSDKKIAIVSIALLILGLGFIILHYSKEKQEPVTTTPSAPKSHPIPTPDKKHVSTSQTPQPEPKQEETIQVEPEYTKIENVSESASNASPTPQSTSEKFAELITQLEGNPTPIHARKVILQLQGYLASLPPGNASQKLRAYLKEGTDIPLPFHFQLTPNGYLSEYPTLRLFMLDYLAKVDPPYATKYARQIVQDFHSPDEWAVALRTIAQNAPKDHAFLLEKTEQLFRHEAWQNNPSAGYLESFDLAVYLGSNELVPTLSELVRNRENKAVARAAFLSLDRLVISTPQETLKTLQQQPNLLSGREKSRANLFARANPTDPAQKEILESYLLDPNISKTEIETFAKIFPNANYMISNNLLTTTQTPSRDTIIWQDQKTIQYLQQWLKEPRFQAIVPQLTNIKKRLERFAESSRKTK